MTGLPRYLTLLALIALLAGCNGSSPSTSSKKPEPEKKVEVPVVHKEEPAAPEVKPPEAPAGRKEDESCLPKKAEKAGYAQSDCAAGLVCAPDVANVTIGTCRASCGEWVKGKPKKAKDASCMAGRTCQMASSYTFDELGAFCLPQQTKRDGLCSAMGDKAACTDNRICAVSEVLKDNKNQAFARSFICRDSCQYGASNAHDTCSAGEKCVAYQYESSSQLNDAGDPVMCTESKCTGDFKECECNRSQGYKCSPLIQGLVAFCERPVGICTTPVAFATNDDFSEGQYQGEVCNEVKGHAFCNNSLFEGVEKPGDAMCVQLSQKTGSGFCYAFCSAPAIDIDGDGKLKSKQEQGQKFQCPPNYSCKTDLARKFGMITSVGDKSSKDGKRVCDPAKCEAGKPCPSECGLGDAECLTHPSKDGSLISFCGAPFGNCEPNK